MARRFRPGKVVWVANECVDVVRVCGGDDSRTRRYEGVRPASLDRLMRLYCAPSRFLVVLGPQRGYLFAIMRREFRYGVNTDDAKCVL